MPPPGHILLSGASTGIGRACALHLASRGHTVHAGVRSHADAQSLAAEASTIARPNSLHPIILDITDPASIAAATAHLEPILNTDGLAGLINNAGIAIPGPVEFVPIDDWRRQFEVNLFGQIALTQAMLPLLRKRVLSGGHGSARIVMMSSIAGLIGQPILSPYCASKHALEALADALRLELAPHGIRTSLIEPGAIQSDIWHKATTAANAIDRASEHYRLYARIIDAVSFRATQAGRNAIHPIAVARAVDRCLRAAKPPERILVGTDAKVAAFAKWLLPNFLFDALIASKLGITTE